MLGDVASRAAAGRSDLTEVKADLAGKVVDLQVMRDQAGILATSATPARLAAEGRCPFKGLATFEPVDADYFFGRERLVAELVARVVGAGFLGIVGPSGSGKSSVLRAGLLPALAGGVLPGSERWRRLLMRPGERPLDELRRVLLSGAPDPLAEALDAFPADGRLLLAVDQLEELFTACRSDDERVAFADALARAAADPQGRAVVVVALRADYYGRFAAYPASPSCSAPTTCSSGRCRLRSCAGPSSCLPGGLGCGWNPSWSTRWSTTSRASRAHCHYCRPPFSSCGRSGATTRWSSPPTGSPEVSTAPSPGWRRACMTASPTSAMAGSGDHAPPGRGGGGARAGAPTRSARRARPGAELGRGPRAGRTGREPPRHGRRALGRGRPRGAAARMATPARMDCRGRRLAPASPSHHRGGDGMAYGRAGSGRAVSRRSSRRCPGLGGRPRARAQRARARVRHREPRGRRAGDEAGAAKQPAPPRAARRRGAPAGCGRDRRSARGRPGRRGPRRRDGSARPAPRRAGARRGGPRSFTAPGAPGGGDR